MSPLGRLPRLGFLGLGWIGRHRLGALQRSGVAEVAALVDSSPDACNEARALAPSAAVYGSLEEILGQDLDGLVIATPSALHAAQTIAALSRGIAVFCQKPLARSAAETEEVILCARACNLLLGVDLSYRWTSAVAAVAGLIRNGSLGHVYASEYAFHNAYGPSSPWFFDRRLSGGGCLLDLGTHLIDLALWIQDASVSRVSSQLFAHGRRLEPALSAVEDHAIVRCEMHDGTVLSVACSWNAPAGCDAVVECRWFGSAGGARVFNVNGSFYDFAAERFDRTATTPLVAPPDDWGGRALIAWAEALAAGHRYDPAVERLVDVAGVIDAAYSGSPFPTRMLHLHGRAGRRSGASTPRETTYDTTSSS